MEHKIRAQSIASLRFDIWIVDFVTAPTVDEANALRNDEVIVGQGGIFMATPPWIHSQITNKGIIRFERGVWHHL